MSRGLTGVKDWYAAELLIKCLSFGVWCSTTCEMKNIFLRKNLPNQILAQYLRIIHNKVTKNVEIKS